MSIHGSSHYFSPSSSKTNTQIYQRHNHSWSPTQEKFLQIQAFSDADWAGSLDNQRSTSGYIVYIGLNSIPWSIKKQPIVAKSFAKA